MRGLALWFMVSAIVYVIADMCFGIYMAVNQDFALAPVHGHLNLIGWVSMALFGLYYHLVPGIAMAILQQGETLAKAGSLLAIVTMLIFMAVVLRNRSTAAA